MRFIFVLLIFLVYQPQVCQTGIATRHQAFEQVFANFPDRLRDDVHGYIATQNCNEMGKRYELRIGDASYTVAVADCRNRSLPKRTDGWIADIDDRLWWASGSPNKPVLVSLCTLP